MIGRDLGIDVRVARDQLQVGRDLTVKVELQSPAASSVGNDSKTLRGEQRVLVRLSDIELLEVEPRQGACGATFEKLGLYPYLPLMCRLRRQQRAGSPE